MKMTTKSFLSLAAIVLSMAATANNEKETDQETSPTKDNKTKLSAVYQIKATLVKLPITLQIDIEKEADHLYQATISTESRIIKINQTERARIENCKASLLSINSSGKKSGDEPWNENIEVDYDRGIATYWYNNKNKSIEHKLEKQPTGIGTLFAYQYIMLKQGEPKKTFQYTQTKEPVFLNFQALSEKEKIKSKFLKEKVNANKIVMTERKEMPEGWFLPDRLGAFPLKVYYKVNTFIRISAELKSISASEAEIFEFFEGWSC